ncbi:MAG: branched-chain amino acid ABC transporter permease [Devosia sp.]
MSQRYVTLTATKTSRVALLVFLAGIIALAIAPHLVPRSLLQDFILVFLLIAMAQCWNLLAGYAGLISVGQQAFVGLGGYGLFAAIVSFGMDPLLAVLLSALCVAVISIPVGFVVFRMQGAYFAVVTWVVAEVFRLLLAQWKALGGGTGTSLPRSATSDMFGLNWAAEVFGVRSAAAREIVIYWAALAVMVVVIAVVYRLLRSRLGLALSAIRDSEMAAESVGVDIGRAKFAAYVFAAFGTALAGALYFLDSARISPDSAFSVLDWTAYVIFIVVIGGIGTIEGPVLGAIIFVVLQSTLSSFGPWYLIVLGVLGIAVMLLAPKGIWGTFSAATGIHLFPTRRRLGAAVPREPDPEA